MRSFKGTIQSFVPLMNGELNSELKSTRLNKETKTMESSTLTLSNNTMFEFSRFSGYNRADLEKLDNQWISKYKLGVIEQLSKKMYAS